MKSTKFTPENEEFTDSPPSGKRPKPTLTEYIDFRFRLLKRSLRKHRRKVEETSGSVPEIAPREQVTPYERKKRNVFVLMIVCVALIALTFVLAFIVAKLVTLPVFSDDPSSTTYENDDGKYHESLQMDDGTYISRVSTADISTLIPPDAENFATVESEKLLSKYAFMLDLDSNTGIAGINADERIYPASMTKVMTLIVACENIRSLTEYIRVDGDTQKEMEILRASAWGFDEGDELSAEALLYAISLRSCAVSVKLIAEKVAGSVGAFTQMMNEKAEALGLENTHFSNPYGLDDEANYTTPREMAVIMKYALSNDLCRKLLCTEQYKPARVYYYNLNGEYICSSPYTFYSTLFGDRLGWKNKLSCGAEILGGKTGYEEKAGYCLVTLARSSSGKEYILVTSGAKKTGDTDPAVIDLRYLYPLYTE